MDVSGHFRDVLIPLDVHRLEPSLEKMPVQPMGPVEANAVRELKPLDGPAQIGLPKPDQQVIMIVHEHEGMDFKTESLGQFGDATEESPTVFVTAENSFPAVTSVDHMVPASRHHDSQRSGHLPILPSSLSISIL